MSAGTRQARSICTTVRAIFLGLIRWAERSVAGAFLLGITFARARPTHLRRGCELTVLAAVLVGVVADGVVPELACLRVAAAVVATVGFAAAIALFARLDDAVTALVPRNRRDTRVRQETVRVDAVASQGRAYVADRARAEVADASARGRVHKISLTGVALVPAERTTLLSRDRGAVVARPRRTIVHGTEGVAGLVCDDLPLPVGPNNDVGSTDAFVVSAQSYVGLGILHARLAKPGQAYGRSGATVGQKGPMRVAILSVSTPLREEIEPILDGDILRAREIPWRGRRRRAGTALFAHGQVAQTKADVEGRLVQIRGRVDLADDVGSCRVGRVERVRVGAVRGDADERHLPRARTADRLADGRPKVDAGRVATQDRVDLTLSQERTGRRHPPEAGVSFQHATVDGVIRADVEFQPIRFAGEILADRPSKLAMRGIIVDGVRVAGNDDIFVVGIFGVGIELVLRLHVAGSQLQMVIVVHDGKGSVEQRSDPISSKHDPRGADMDPRAVFILQPALSPEDLVVGTSYRLRPRDGPTLV